MSMDERRPLLARNQAQQNGRIPSRSRCHTQLACGAILCTEIFERIAFYGIIGNLVLFLSAAPLNWTSYHAANASMLFTGLCYTTSIFGGWLADSVLGRFKTICLFFVIYICGYVLMPLLAYPHVDDTDQTTPTAPRWCAGPNASRNGLSNSRSSWYHSPSVNSSDHHKLWEDMVNQSSTTHTAGDETCSWAIYLALCIMAIGTGAVKANIAPFGAEQVKHEGPYMMRVFFNWFYWCINIGALVALGLLAYVQQQYSFFWGLVAPNICLVIALVIFTIGGLFYIMRHPGGSVLTNITRILLECCRVGQQRRITSTMTRRMSILTSMDLSDMPPPPSCIDNAKVRYGGSFHDAMVDDVKVLGRILLVFMAMVPYWVVYFQMASTYVVQGLHMRLDFGDGNNTNPKTFKIPAAWLSLFDVVFLIVLIPVMDRVIYPRLDNAGYHLSLRLRIVIGMVFSVLSVATAGGLEAYRLSVYWENGTEHVYPQFIGGTNYSAANISVLWQIPQYALIGISEVFASVAGLELAYTHAPRSMQGIMMGLFWFMQGVGSLVGTASINLFQGVFFFHMREEDINCRIPCTNPGQHGEVCHVCHLDYYFFVLAGLQLLGLFVFIFVVVKFDVGINRVQRRHYVDVSSSASNESLTSPGRRSASRLSSPNRHDSPECSFPGSPKYECHVQQQDQGAQDQGSQGQIIASGSSGSISAS